MRRRFLVLLLIQLTAGIGLAWRASVAVAVESPQEELAAAALSLVKQQCGKCHGGATPKAQLVLQTPQGIARGDADGRVIVPGKLGESRLWQQIDRGEMPPDAPLNAAQRDVLRRWIEAGAPGLPAASPDGGGFEHWAFRALTPHRPIAVAPSRLVRNDIDGWVQARLAKFHLSLGPDAHPEALLRRLSVDLTGLPPSPEDVVEFTHDRQPDGYERWVDRYLASPRLGERWGKHWLDVAGYADSNGYFSADTDRPLAYRYRDYVVRSVNRDKPFDQFLREQLAGDELSGFRPEQPTTPEAIELLEATHFLRNGQDGSDIGVMEPEAQTVDRRAALEAVVQVTASSLLGLTLHCARCHDHKFEPIPLTDYYRFQAIVFPAFNPTDWILPKDRTVFAYLPGERETWEANQQRVAQALEQARAEFAEWAVAHRESGDVLFRDAFDPSGGALADRWSSTAPGDNGPGGGVMLDTATPNSARIDNGALQVIAGSGESWLSTKESFDWTPDAVGAWIQATFDLVDNKVAGGPAERIGYTIAAVDFQDDGPVDGGNLLIDGNPTAATNVYRDYPGPDQKMIGAIGQQGYTPGHNYGVRVTNLGEGKYRLEHLVDWIPEGISLELAAADLPDGGFALFYCNARSFVVDNVVVERSKVVASQSGEVAKQRDEFKRRREQYDTRRKQLESERSPQPGRAIAWVSDKAAQPPVVPLLTRGQYDAPGPAVEPAGLAILTDAGRELRVEPPSSGAPTTGRRLALARWLTRSDGRPAALVARVHTNRIWRQYFDRGIVATTDNLGQSGAAPSHPELLEHLARTLVTDDWSQKRLHRAIVTSTVYRQSSAARPEAMAVDLGNRWWWRWPLRRLDAEMIRDGMLAASGELDLTMAGPYVPTRQTPVGEVIADEAAAGAQRRSLYLQQRRSQTLSLLKVFDAPALATVCSSRPASSVPLQSLALLNSEFSLRRAEALAARVTRDVGREPSLSVRRAWLLAIGREPTSDELAVGRDFLAHQTGLYADQAAADWALADFCQMLLASNALLYLE